MLSASRALLILALNAVSSGAIGLDAAASREAAGGTGEFTVVIPAAASVHGVPPAFFHSDLVVFNRSGDQAAAVRATYRCTSGPCGSASITFDVPTREIRLLEDVVATLFGAPETSGAIELTSTEPIVVGSRLYTPARPAPTLGMYVPGLGPERGFASSDLVQLSHSADPSVGYRTNVGVFNPGDDGKNVIISCRDFQGALLGIVRRFVDAHRLLQINDGELFREFSILRDAPFFECSVQGSSVAPLYAWGTVIDNRSGDATFVIGQRFFTAHPVLTIPALASLRGAGDTFFRSEIAVFNDDVAGGIADVTAEYRCFLGECTQSLRTFRLGPAEMRIFPDSVANFFGSPGSAGWLDLAVAGHVSVSSRLYTDSPGGGTVGMVVPALDRSTASSSQVLPLIAAGSRVNVGVVNIEPVPQVVTFRVYSDVGRLIGTVTRLLLANEGTQVNDIFRAIGASSEESAGYCLVSGNRPFRIHAYAAIIDNSSQDPFFVVGEDDPESPPIE